MPQDRKPDWEWWGNVDEVTVIEAVALSMDIDPNKLHYRKPPGTMGAAEVRDESPEFEKRFSLAIRNLKVLEAWGIGVVGKLEYCLVKPAKFAAVALTWNWKIPPQMVALAEPDKRDAEILKLRRHVEELTDERDTWKRTASDVSPNTTNAARGDLTKAQHAARRERTLAAVLATMATADRKDYTNESDQKIVVTKLAGLVEDNRMKYERPGKILSVEEIKNLVGKILNGDYFP